MTETSDDLTGSLPPLTGAADAGTSTARVQALLDEVATDSRLVDRTARIDEFIARKVARLADLRRAAGLTQAQVAKELGVSQSEISKLEGRETHLVDTLSRFVSATGGRLHLVVEYDDGTRIEYEPA